MAPLHLLEDRHRAKPRCRLQHRHDLAIEDVGERIRAAATPYPLLVRRKPAILLEAISGGRADRCLRRRHRRQVCLSELHVKPHLLIGDMAAGQWAAPFNGKIRPHTRSVAITRPSVPPDGNSDRLFRDLRLRSGSALPSAQAPESSLILIVGLSHLDCRAAASRASRKMKASISARSSALTPIMRAPSSRCGSVARSRGWWSRR